MAEENIESLKMRRIRRRDGFLRKVLTNPRFSQRWFPPREGLRPGLRRPRLIQEARSVTWRRFQSPLEALRRRANELGMAAQ